MPASDKPNARTRITKARITKLGSTMARERTGRKAPSKGLRHGSLPHHHGCRPHHHDLQGKELHLPAGHRVRRGLLHTARPGRAERGLPAGQGKGRRHARRRLLPRRRMPGRPSALPCVGAGLHGSHRRPCRDCDTGPGHERSSRAVGALHGVPAAAQQPGRGGPRRPAFQFEREAPRAPARHAGPGRPGGGAAHQSPCRSARR